MRHCLRRRLDLAGIIRRVRNAASLSVMLTTGCGHPLDGSLPTTDGAAHWLRRRKRGTIATTMRSNAHLLQRPSLCLIRVVSRENGILHDQRHRIWNDDLRLKRSRKRSRQILLCARLAWYEWYVVRLLLNDSGTGLILDAKLASSSTLRPCHPSRCASLGLESVSTVLAVFALHCESHGIGIINGIAVFHGLRRNLTQKTWSMAGLTSRTLADTERFP
mmetsp:Transcript_14811/g.40695  ORF Transcript_14811/g.40695 Transcript_14811/m.40695 type:complete len:219 (-) Transcript_14811:478-1134(-)